MNDKQAVEKKLTEKERRSLPSLSTSDITEGKWYNNAGTRSRYVVGFQGFYALYTTPANKSGVTGVLLSAFAKWAKGVGKL